MRRGHILIITAVFPPEPVTSALINYDLARDLAKEYEVTVIRPLPTRPDGVIYDNAEVDDESFKTILIRSYTHPKSDLLGRFMESVDFGIKSYAFIKKYHDEIDFVYNDGWQLFGLAIVARICMKYDIPYIVPIQDIYPESLVTNKRYFPLIKACIIRALMPIDKYYQKNAACVRTISDEMCEYLSRTRGVEKEKYLVVNNWQNDSDFLMDYTPKANNRMLVFAYVGSINEHANVELMIRAFSEAAIPNSELRIFGGGSRKMDCEKMVTELDLTNVSFDLVSRDKIAAVQSQVDVLLLALPKGNGTLCLPSKLTSYMLSGKPVLASVDKDSSTARIITESVSGLAVEPDSVDALKGGFEYFAQLQREDLLAMGESSRLYAINHLTREINLKKVVDRIKTIINNN